MTTLGNENARLPLDKLKRRAYTIQTRLAELGHPVPLTHAYETLAASSGYRNWPTMRATAARSSGSLVIGHETIRKANRSGAFSTGMAVTANPDRPISVDGGECLGHFEIVGQGGRTRSDILSGFSASAVERGSPLVAFDATGDTTGYERLLDLADRHGRRKDVLRLNLLGEHPASAKFNPFGVGSGVELAGIVNALDREAPPAGGTDDALWMGRRGSMLTGLLTALAWLRDNRSLPLDVTAIRDGFNLRSIARRLADARNGMPEETWKPIERYLTSLPGYNPAAGEHQPQTTLDQHGYLEMMLTKTFAGIADRYGHVFAGGGSAALTMADILRERRILHVQLPKPLRKEPQTITETFRLLFLDLIRALKDEAGREGDTGGIVAVFDGVEDLVPLEFSESLAVASASGRAMAFGWQVPPLAHALKRATSIHMADATSTRATVVTGSRTVDAIMKAAE